MHEDLRRRALESGKTLSRKAVSRKSSAIGSRAGSTASSPAGSRAASRNSSRQASDDEDGDNYSDGVSGWSNASIDGVLFNTEDEPNFSWEDELSIRIEQILDRKRSSVQGREEDLVAYVHILRARYANDVVSRKFSELLAAFLRSIRTETSEKETVTALKAIQITVLTDTSDTSYGITLAPLKSAISSSEFSSAKTEAIYALGIVTFYGGASEEEIEEMMDYLLETIESDGAYISADDDANVVTAALDSWGFLATQLEDMEDSSTRAMEGLIEQLESADPRVQISAGENIALLYEKSYTDIESDEELSDSEDVDPDGSPPTKIKRYDPYRRKDQLLHALETLASVSSKRLSKKDRKSLHTNFADIRQSVENPRLGPRYSTAIDDETDKHYGSRLTIKVSKTSTMRIDRWWKLHRLKALRRVLQGGFLEHYEKNNVVLETLPVLTS